MAYNNKMPPPFSPPKGKKPRPKKRTDRTGLRKGQLLSNQNTAKAITLLCKNVPAKIVAQDIGCAVQTVQAIARRYTDIIQTRANVPDYEEKRSSLISAVEAQALECVSDGLAAGELSPAKAVQAFKTLHSAGRLERGASTSNKEIIHKFLDIELASNPLKKQEE